MRGRLSGKHIELDEQVDELDGEVEVFVRALRATEPLSRLADFVAALPPGSRSKDDIDRELGAERAGWERHG